MKVFLVGHSGPEHNHIDSIYLSYTNALIRFHEIRRELIEEAESGLEYSKKDDGFGVEMYTLMISKLKEEDPKKIENYPHDTPFIREVEVKP